MWSRRSRVRVPALAQSSSIIPLPRDGKLQSQPARGRLTSAGFSCAIHCPDGPSLCGVAGNHAHRTAGRRRDEGSRRCVRRPRSGKSTGRPACRRSSHCGRVDVAAGIHCTRSTARKNPWRIERRGVLAQDSTRRRRRRRAEWLAPRLHLRTSRGCRTYAVEAAALCRRDRRRGTAH